MWYDGTQIIQSSDLNYMVKKLKCNVTGNISYLTPKRYRKATIRYGGEANLERNFISLTGRKIQEGKLDEFHPTKNYIQCTVSGRWCYITNQRISASIKKHGSYENVRSNYICRDARRLLKDGTSIEEIREREIRGVLQ